MVLNPGDSTGNFESNASALVWYILRLSVGTKLGTAEDSGETESTNCSQK